MKVKFLDYYTGELVTEKTMNFLPSSDDLVIINGASYEIMPNKWFYLDDEVGNIVMIYINKL